MISLHRCQSQLPSTSSPHCIEATAKSEHCLLNEATLNLMKGIATMPQTPAEISAHTNYQSIFDNALQEYEKNTRKDLSLDPLFRRLQSCDSPDNIITMLQQQT